MSNTPKYYAYAVNDRGKDKKSIWTRIGAAWDNSKGDGLNITLEALPVDGKIVLKLPKPKDAGADTFEGEAA